MKEVVLDIETQNSFQDVGEYNPALLRVSLVGVYFYETDTYESFLEPDLPKLWPRLEQADRIIGYNILGFDFPVLNRYYAGDLNKIPSLDIMYKLEEQLGFRVKLDNVAQATLGTGKSGHGLMAIEYFRKGEIDKLRDYCLQDVKVTKEVYEFAKRENRVFITDRTGEKIEVKADDYQISLEAARPSINLTMPF
ncbi:MAG: ribonuclease H-like domain-containing protein [bacterium]